MSSVIVYLLLFGVTCVFGWWLRGGERTFDTQMSFDSDESQQSLASQAHSSSMMPVAASAQLPSSSTTTRASV